MNNFLSYILLICLCINTSNASMMCCVDIPTTNEVMNEISSEQEKPPCHGVDSNKKDLKTFESASMKDDGACCDCYDCVQMNGIVLEQFIPAFQVSDSIYPQHPHSLGLIIKLIFDPPILNS